VLTAGRRQARGLERHMDRRRREPRNRRTVLATAQSMARSSRGCRKRYSVRKSGPARAPTADAIRGARPTVPRLRKGSSPRDTSQLAWAERIGACRERLRWAGTLPWRHAGGDTSKRRESDVMTGYSLDAEILTMPSQAERDVTSTDSRVSLPESKWGSPRRAVSRPLMAL
jgi:hypothetical protein